MTPHPLVNSASVLWETQVTTGDKRLISKDIQVIKIYTTALTKCLFHKGHN